MSEAIFVVFIILLVVSLARQNARRQRHRRDRELLADRRSELGKLEKEETRAVGDRSVADARIAEIASTIIAEREHDQTEPPSIPSGWTVSSDQSAFSAETVEDEAGRREAATVEGVPSDSGAGPTSAPDDGDAAPAGPDGGTTPDGDTAVRDAQPQFAEIDVDQLDAEVVAALDEPDDQVAERLLRMASLRGSKTADLVLGMRLWRAGRTHEAEGALRNIARTHGTAANNLAVMLESEGRFREARNFYRRGRDLDNDEAAANLARMEG